MVPKNITHLLQPLDLTTNAGFKKYETRAFSEYLSAKVMEALKNDLACDITTIKVDLRLSDGKGSSKEQLCMRCNDIKVDLSLNFKTVSRQSYDRFIRVFEFTESESNNQDWMEGMEDRRGIEGCT